MGVSRSSLYYVATQDKKDWALKVRMEEELQKHPSYGARRLADALGVNRKRTQRVMRIYGIKPYRRHGRKYRKSKTERHFPNLLLGIMPSYPNHIWATDFTELAFHGKKVYVSTIVDLFTRELRASMWGQEKERRSPCRHCKRALPPSKANDISFGQREGIRGEGVHRPARAVWHYDLAIPTRQPMGEWISGIVLREIQNGSW